MLILELLSIKNYIKKTKGEQNKQNNLYYLNFHFFLDIKNRNQETNHVRVEVVRLKFE